MDVLHRVEQEEWARNMLVRVILEEFTSEDDDVPFQDRVGTVALTTHDDQVNVPIYSINLQKAYRLRITMKHMYRKSDFVRRMTAIQVKPPDEDALNLSVVEVKNSSAYEAVALLDLNETSSQKLNTVSPVSGPLERKYVTLDIMIDVQIDDRPFRVPLDCDMMCRLLPPDAKQTLKRVFKGVTDRWMEMPQLLRDGIRGALVIATVAADAVPAPVAINPNVVFRFVRLLRKVCPLDCEAF